MWYETAGSVFRFMCCDSVVMQVQRPNVSMSGKVKVPQHERMAFELFRAILKFNSNSYLSEPAWTQ